jgi:hypothetical protein
MGRFDRYGLGKCINNANKTSVVYDCGGFCFLCGKTDVQNVTQSLNQ